MSPQPTGEFGLVVSFDSDTTTLGVRGDVDMLTAPALRGILSGLVDQGYTDVVLDLSALSFMDAAGLGVIATASARLAESDGVLRVRAAPAQTRKILALTGLSQFVQLEARQTPSGKPSRVVHLGDPSLAVHGGSFELSSDIAQAGSADAGNLMTDAALALVTALASASVEGVDGVTVSLERNGHMSTVASSNSAVMQMDDHQYTSGAGPCLSAAAEGRRFHVASLAEETRWPAFIPLALADGIASILSTPLMVGERSLGALNMYSNTDRAFGKPQQELAELFAAQATKIVVDAAIEGVVAATVTGSGPDEVRA